MYFTDFLLLSKSMNEMSDLNKSLNEKVDSLQISLPIAQSDARVLSEEKNVLAAEKRCLEVCGQILIIL